MSTTDTLLIGKRTFGEIAILDCTGRVVVGKQNEHLFDAVTTAIEKNRSVLLNLAGVSMIDSGGLGMMVLLHRYAVNSGCELRLCQPTPLVSEIFSVTRLNTVLGLHDDEDTAIEHFFRDVA